MQHVLIIRLGELVLKGENRSKFEQTVLQQVNALLVGRAGVRSQAEFGRIYIFLEDEALRFEIRSSLLHLFGVHSIIPAIATNTVQADIETAAVQLMNAVIVSDTAQSFKVDGKRVDKKFPLTSVQLSARLGGVLLQALPQLSVDLHTPQFTLHAEVRMKQAFVFIKEHAVPGAGGFPLASNGRALALLSGGIDSPVASWLAMRRGLYLELVHFHSYPYTSEQSREKVIKLAQCLARYCGTLKLHMVPFTPVQEYIRRKIQDRLWVTVMRRAMLTISERLAAKLSLHALVTGDSLGQVASQTLGSLQAMEDVTSIPVLRPLITMDKQEIITIAAQIETLSISQLPFEDCCALFVPNNPSTNPNLKVVKESEKRSRLLEELINTSLEQTEMLEINGLQEVNGQPLHPLL